MTAITSSPCCRRRSCQSFAPATVTTLTMTSALPALLVLALAMAEVAPATAAGADGGSGRGASAHVGHSITSDAASRTSEEDAGTATSFEVGVMPRGFRDEWFANRYSELDLIPGSDDKGGFDTGEAVEEDARDAAGGDTIDDDVGDVDDGDDEEEETGEPVFMTPESPAPPAGTGGDAGGAGACGDPMVKEMIGLDNKDRSVAGSPSLKCDTMAGKLALAWSQGQCQCVSV